MDNIRYEVGDGIAWITLDRPDAYNALDVATATELGGAVAAAAGDNSVRCAVLTGSGRAFCAGGDVRAFHANLGEAPDYIRALVTPLHGALLQLYEMPVPVVTAVNGVAAGAGMGLAIAGDVAIAATSARFTMAYTALGATPDAGTTHRLTQLVGTRRATELALTNRSLSAEEALDWGLVNRVVADADLEAAAGEIAKLLAAGPTEALVGSRRLIQASVSTPAEEQLDAEADSIVARAGTAEFREGVTAFVEKREPAF